MLKIHLKRMEKNKSKITQTNIDYQWKLLLRSIMPPLKTSIHTFNKEERSEVRVQCEAANNMSTLAKLQYLFQFASEPQNENVYLKSSKVQIFYIFNSLWFRKISTVLSILTKSYIRILNKTKIKINKAVTQITIYKWKIKNGIKWNLL